MIPSGECRRPEDDAGTGPVSNGGLGRWPRMLGQFRKTEISQLGVAALRQQNIFRLDVTMQDIDRMRRSQRIGDANQQLYDLPPRPRSLRPLPQRAPIHEFRNQILAIIEFARVVHRHDVRMIE